MLSETDKAYAAGIIDGEGSIMWGGGRLVVAVSMSKPDVINWLAEKFGGTLSGYENDGGNPMFSWKLWSGTCGPFLELIKPYVMLKIVQLEVGLAMASTYRKRGGDQNLLLDNEE